MKWLPDPSVPICFVRPLLTELDRLGDPVEPPPEVVPARRRRTRAAAPGPPGSSCIPRPTGIACSIFDRSRERSPGRSFAVSEVFTADMPQPMSTPTAAGQTAPCIAMTEPTVAPLP